MLARHGMARESRDLCAQRLAQPRLRQLVRCAPSQLSSPRDAGLVLRQTEKSVRSRAVLAAPLGNPTHSPVSCDSQSTYVLRHTFADGRALTMYMGDRWNEASESAPGSVGGASYVWLPMVRNGSDPTGWSMPRLHGQWNGTGQWRVADYLEPAPSSRP